MPTERQRVNLSVTPSRFRNILKFGSEQGVRGAGGRLSVSSILMNIITSILDLYSDPAVKAYMHEKDVRFLGLIHRAVRDYISSDRN